MTARQTGSVMHSQTTGVGPCRHCGHYVSVTATTCRFCGYNADPDENARARAIWSINGLNATLSIIGTPIGLVLAWKAYHHHRAATGRVIDTGHPPTRFPLGLLAAERQARRIEVHRNEA